VDKASTRERRAVAPNPMPKISLADDVGRVPNSSVTSVNSIAPTRSRPSSSTWVVSGHVAGLFGAWQRAATTA
jgi:hypothetical protein